MTTLERACIAIIDELKAQGELVPGCGDPEWAQCDGSFRVEPLVRAVLTAIREPSEGMADSGNACVDPRYAEDGSYTDAADAWQAMIDAALREG